MQQPKRHRFCISWCACMEYNGLKFTMKMYFEFWIYISFLQWFGYKTVVKLMDRKNATSENTWIQKFAETMPPKDKIAPFGWQLSHLHRSSLHGRRKVWKSWGASSNVKGIICLLSKIGFVNLSKNGSCPHTVLSLLQALVDNVALAFSNWKSCALTLRLLY